jgi:hypothetical protein
MQKPQAHGLWLLLFHPSAYESFLSPVPHRIITPELAIQVPFLRLQPLLQYPGRNARPSGRGYACRYLEFLRL